MIVERDAARTEIERERTHGEQRVNDLRTTQDQQLAQLRDERAELRQEVRDQRGRADRTEARLAVQTDVHATKSAKRAVCVEWEHWGVHGAWVLVSAVERGW